MTARILKTQKASSKLSSKSKTIKTLTKRTKNKRGFSTNYSFPQYIHVHLRGIFFGILIFILTLFVIFGYTKFELYFKKTLISNIYTPTYSNEVFYGLTEDNVDFITIKTVQETFTLKKNVINTKIIWVIGDKQISQDKIDRLFSSLYTFNQGSLLSKNPKNHLELGINDLLGSFVTIKAGVREVNFVIGNPSSVLNSFYFRLQGSPEVYLSTGDLRSIVTSGKSYWIE